MRKINVKKYLAEYVYYLISTLVDQLVTLQVYSVTLKGLLIQGWEPLN